MQADLFTKYQFPIVNTPKIEYEFQAVCLECEDFFGKNPLIWMQPHRKGVTENMMRYALKECITRDKKIVGYFVKILSNKIKK